MSYQVRKRKVQMEERGKINRSLSFDFHEYRACDKMPGPCDECKDIVDFFLEALYDVTDLPITIAEKYAPISLRDFITDMCGSNVERAAATIGVNKLTVYRWLNAIEDGGEVKVKVRRIRRKLRELRIVLGPIAEKQPPKRPNILAPRP